MTVGFNIEDGSGNRRKAIVDTRNALVVTNTEPDVPTTGTSNRYRYASLTLGSTGANSGITNMAVDGSVTPQSFYISSSTNYDIRINKIVVKVVDGSVSLSKFGAILALTNGFSLVINESGDETYIIREASTLGELWSETTGDFKIQANFDDDNDDIFLLTIDVNDVVPNGIRLGNGTLDRITATVNDNLTGLANFEVILFGYFHYP